MQKKILIIEDDDFFRGLIGKKLLFEEFDVYMASNGEEGVSKLKEHKPDLVLLDMLLPSMDGFEVLTKIKEDSVLALTPVIIASNLVEKEDVDRALKMGAIDYMIKSQYTPEMIIEKVKKVLGK
ncbi:MAG: hypothetical protein A3C50_00525 [Candidatus Staskawiczbacteria bacterium RIFCSPHIGHO2_02_FULL_43_16]|uniref:Response regulatory domain-containing protein n=1 Tax=Candidatus Staskawiczbacteria bacterium RIFCSPHIGHO2_01_FULL_41_41 TaxID=1802203 RepID=A0A1G2HTE0_9BACT|nr:MAG: hypothetical protein A2822_04370 [Candidatus Staskawiczbacteria bacterium RIFCSPHIGHO2_01_FULL_41_41]OGZ68248.1 MAG: hypothetical protein A3C50_00525 [Candidatus Staskawiczbacteria bacterium RIFCSPHIGHO2_02_FULL_43_16]OGZ74636.1 MAG: hypothetical protein A3A12_00620 [Candidatus Staskawiczbacteria bacterium RIFCSPLOWO2_01_FULL_43_17b]